MENGFLLYVIYSTAIVLLLSLIFILLMIRRKRRRSKVNNVFCIEGGSVSVFFDEDNNVTVIPYSKDKYGVGRAASGPLFLKAPYKPMALGELIRQSMAMCKGGAISNDQLMRKLNCRDWGVFSNGKRNISIYYKEQLGLVFNTTRRGPDGAYNFNFRGYEKVLDKNAGNDELGVVIMNLLERCRC